MPSGLEQLKEEYQSDDDDEEEEKNRRVQLNYNNLNFVMLMPSPDENSRYTKIDDNTLLISDPKINKLYNKMITND